MQGKVRPKGGRGKRSFYASHVRRIPSPVVDAVDALVDEFYQELVRVEALPITGKWWEVLGVSSDASGEDVKWAYRQLVKICHPDVNKLPEAENRFKSVLAAYEESQDSFKKVL